MGDLCGDIPSGFSNQDIQVSISTNDSVLSTSGNNTPTVSDSSLIVNTEKETTINRNYEDIKKHLVQNEGMKLQLNLNEQKEENINKTHHEMITSIEDRVQKIKEFQFPSLNFTQESLSDRPINPNRQQFFENFTHYNEKLSKLAKCYAEQTSRLANIHECLKRCINVLEILENNKILTSSHEYKKILEDCRSQMINDELQNIPERENLIQAHNQFQKIFSDYNSALIELENIREESLKTAEMAKIMEKEQQVLTKDKETMEIEKQQISMESKRLMAQQINLNQEKANLDEEKSSLNSQSMLYEAQMRNLQDSMKVLQTRHDDMLTESTKLKEEIRLKDIELAGIRARLELSKDDVNILIACIKIIIVTIFN